MFDSHVNILHVKKNECCFNFTDIPTPSPILHRFFHGLRLFPILASKKTAGNEAPIENRLQCRSMEASGC